MSAPDNSRPGSPGRFAEESATYAISSSHPDLEAGVAAIRNTLDTLGAEPGVYRMLDANEQVLYVGKARALKNRVANYTQVSRLPRRLQRMVSQTRQMTIIVTRSEAEALLLEAQLIKRFRPAYNVLLRDDKSFPFIALDQGHAFPRLSKHRGARKPDSRYFGPFASAGAVNTTLNALQKVFLLRSCSDSYMSNRSRPCLLHQIRRCSAPCVGRIDEAGYGELVDEALQFLSGRSQQVQKKLGGRMAEAAAVQDYELAAVLRDRLKALTAIQGSQAINAQTDSIDADVIAIHGRDGIACVQIFFIRNGQNWGHRAVFPSHVGGVSEPEVLAAFLGQFYTDLMPAKLILIDREVPESALMAEALSTRAGHRVEIRVPQRGHLKRLVEQAERNAREAVDRRLAESTTQQRNLHALADLFGLPAPPERIEIYDNSHIQGSNALGAMVVATSEGFAKSQYRKFNMKQGEFAPGDDFAMMTAMLTRRFARLQAELPEGGEGWPDLLLIDGGKGQVSAAVAALADLQVEDVAIVGVAKGPDRNAGREIFHLPDGRELTLPPNDPLLFFLQRLRDEAHRFVIGAHRSKRSKALTVSTLDEVPGIGPARKKALLSHFGTARAVKGAALEDLLKVPGINRSTAETVYEYFRSRN
ncbi:excinuclease ABC subunit UvrC [Sandaracinobacter sp. RS1-74]|uniref:excinuclease ABC subunit UvrC n=1 Tax=Sandaracinobacteroides sayramensis TaxID=2913411 RepID=UPI001EDB8ACB|nr:excinuclease ABC subunit UvrC [Sandaracinobacteroides sayramensis]MCG2840088.1 excinuclease ABC subunit UvrC [Sandaracinobacteroides sayramensis]